MIQIISGVYGSNPPKRAGDKPFSLSPAEEARLVKMGVAVYVHTPDMAPIAEPIVEDQTDAAPIGFDETPPEDGEVDEAEIVEEIIDLETLSAKELRELGKEYGLTFKATDKKSDMIEAITEAQSQIEEIGEDAPTFDAAEAVL